jgi:hypothetical protein
MIPKSRELFGQDHAPTLKDPRGRDCGFPAKSYMPSKT